MLMTLDISEVIMFKTTAQRVLFIIGLVWLGYGVVITLLDAAEGASHLIGTTFVCFLPTLIIWHFTGVLKPMLNWFRGSKQ